uniref:Glycosylation-dependent cell adhesion molecule 1 n=1 Tax=Felis catus TaxID=9685 RepID=A0ABI8A3H2_FELCA
MPKWSRDHPSWRWTLILPAALIGQDLGTGNNLNSTSCWVVIEDDYISYPNASREELGFEEDDMTKSTRRPKRQRPELLHPIPQEDSIRNAASQSEETTELTPRAATTSEGKPAKLGHKIGKNLDETVKETMSYLKNLLPHAYEVIRPSPGQSWCLTAPKPSLPRPPSLSSPRPLLKRCI